jgi:predicted Zn-dependent protease
MAARAVLKVACFFALAVAAWQVPSAGAQIFTDAEAELRVRWLQMKREMPRHPSQAVQRYTECIARAIIHVIPPEWQNLDWEVIVFDDESRNASVTPEGKIAVFSGILEVADTPNELAAVLGHEVAHLTEGHVKARVLAAAGTGVVGVLGGVLTGFGNESQRVAQAAIQLPYQRGQEGEADIVGMSYMAKAGYDPTAVLDLWRDMSGGDENRGSNWLSTHPNPRDRMTDMALNLSPALKAYNDALDAGVRPRCRID